MMEIKKGNLFSDLDSKVREHGEVVIAHLCNNIGVFGAGFSKNFPPSTRKGYHTLCREFGKKSLGRTSIEVYAHNILVAHMIAQDGINAIVHVDRVDYEALDKCLKTVDSMNVAVMMPMIGMGLAGANDWSRIENIILLNISSPVYVYRL